ncbi:MAG: PKD domain-containing protein [ANME-2 cluster archaeon]|nr:PKD domain-containing protein [ANME-2 cluster archaeon]
MTEASGSGSVSDIHTYATPGIYTIVLTVNDDEGSAGMFEYRYVVIYDTSGGFVTGGGWINSTAGAYVADLP